MVNFQYICGVLLVVNYDTSGPLHHVIIMPCFSAIKKTFTNLADRVVVLLHAIYQILSFRLNERIKGSSAPYDQLDFQPKIDKKHHYQLNGKCVLCFAMI
jgi:hypothetical protein